MKAMSHYPRLAEAAITDSLRHFPVTAITGPRQCGKSTLSKRLGPESAGGAPAERVYLDMERPSDLAAQARH